LYRETNLSEIDSRIISFLPSLGIVVFNIIQGYIQISPCMKPLAVCMQGMNLLLWSVNSSTGNHAFYFDLSTVAPATMPSSITLTEQKSGENTFVALLSIMIPSPLSLLASVPYC
jgi:hypothetical protein